VRAGLTTATRWRRCRRDLPENFPTPALRGGRLGADGWRVQLRRQRGPAVRIHYDLDDQAIYCSELIYKAFERNTGEKLGKLQKLGELKWQAHAPVIREIEGGRLPLERVMITPRSVTEASQLTKVFEQ